MWSAHEVERRLIAAFRFLPGHPVFSVGHRLVEPFEDRAGHIVALGWARAYVTDPQAALALMTWASCRARGESVRERYGALGWSRSVAERARRRAVARIVTQLNQSGVRRT